MVAGKECHLFNYPPPAGILTFHKKVNDVGIKNGIYLTTDTSFLVKVVGGWRSFAFVPNERQMAAILEQSPDLLLTGNENIIFISSLEYLRGRLLITPNLSRKTFLAELGIELT